jgi:hypothetical protein
VLVVALLFNAKTKQKGVIMSLDWNIGKCVDMESLKSEDEWPTTEAFIWSTMSIGMNRITEENASEFYARLTMWERLCHGELIQKRNPETKKWEYVRVSYDDVKKRIGLYTNASNETRSEWLKRITKYINRELDDYKSYAK